MISSPESARNHRSVRCGLTAPGCPANEARIHWHPGKNPPTLLLLKVNAPMILWPVRRRTIDLLSRVALQSP